jgi:hypothetical protein
MKLKYLILVLLSLFLPSCFYTAFLIGYKYKITKKYIKSNHSFYQGFDFSELKVDSTDLSGIPIAYQRVRSASLYIPASYKKKNTHKIYFYKANDGFFWNYESNFRLPILPIKMEKNKWYIIDRLVFWGNPSLSKFIYIDEKDKCHTYSVPHISNW